MRYLIIKDSRAAKGCLRTWVPVNPIEWVPEMQKGGLNSTFKDSVHRIVLGNKQHTVVTIPDRKSALSVYTLLNCCITVSSIAIPK